MVRTYEKRLAKLDTLTTQVTPEDALPIAGRKLLAVYFTELLQQAPAIAYSTDALPRTTTVVRRARHLFTVLDDYYKNKIIKAYRPMFDRIYTAIDRVHAYDRLLTNLAIYQSNLDSADEMAFQAVVSLVREDAHSAIATLEKLFERKKYHKFVKSFTKFLLKDGKGVIAPKADVAPYEVRHLAPVLLHEQLAQVRAYDDAINSGDRTTLQELYHTAEDLLDTIAFFEPVLGKSASDFITKLTVVVGLVDGLNMAVLARATLHPQDDLSDEQNDLIQQYLAELDDAAELAISALPEAWASFNTRTTQRKFADALLVLR